MFNKYLLPVAASLALLLPAVAANALTVSLVQSTSGPITVGDAVSFDLVTSADFGTISGFQGELTYDADVLSFGSVDYASFLNFPQNPIFDPVEPMGASGVTVLSKFLAGQFMGVATSGMTTLATFNFSAVGASASSNLLFGPFNGALVTDAGLNPFEDVTSNAATLTVLADDVTAPIPLPAGAWLLLSGLAGISAFRLRRKA